MSSLENISERFPILANNPDLSYLDSAATTQKPDCVLDALLSFYRESNANIHRGVYRLSEVATATYEKARHSVAQYVGAEYDEEIIFTYGTTFGLNLIAHGMESSLKPGDEILLPISEHHSNIVSWELVARRTGASLKFIPLNEDLTIDMQEAERLVSPRTRIIAFAHVSNVLGTTLPVSALVQLANSVDAVTVCDGAQWLAHHDVNVRELGVDYYVFSAHKMCGPTGIGALYGRRSLLEDLPPFLGGGDMITEVTTSGSSWAGLPNKFEAGTPPIAQAAGFGACIGFLQEIDRPAAIQLERKLGEALLDVLTERPDIRVLVGDKSQWQGTVSFAHRRIHPHDLATILDGEGVCVRAGHHCAQPLMQFLGLESTVRASPYFYNTMKDVERFAQGIAKAEQLLL